MSTLKSLLLLSVILMPTLVQASPSYKYVVGGYENVKRSGNQTMTGYGIGTVLPFNDRYHFVAAHGDVDNDTQETKMTVVMAGYRRPLSDTTDFVVRAGWAWQTTEFPTVTNKDNGYSVAIGLRSMLTPRFELNGWVGSHRTHRTRATIGLEGTYRFHHRFGLYTGVDYADKGRNLKIGLRVQLD